MKELIFERDGKKIYGKLYLPKAEDKVPVVIIAHGFGSNLSSNEYYASKFVENGIAAYIFDFIGGGHGIKSDGETTEMSVLTEATDMNIVLDGIAALPEINKKQIFLMGGSQGGFVASYVAAKRVTEVKGLIALYPAYVLQEDAWKRTPNPDEIPETMNVMGMTIGKIYNKDAMSFDIYEVIKSYLGNVLIIHGTSDSLVPVSCSEKAIELFPSAKLVKINGAGHGFNGTDEDYAGELAVQFVKENMAL